MKDDMCEVMRVIIIKIIISMFCLTISFSQNESILQPLSNQQSALESEDLQQAQVDPKLFDAIIEYKRLIKKYPDKKELSYNLGNLNYLSGNLESAIKNYNNSLLNKDAEKKAHALYNLGNVFQEQGDINKSVELFKEALRLDPVDEDIRHNYELSKLMLEREPQKQNKQNDDSASHDNKQEQSAPQSGKEGNGEQEKSQNNEDGNGNEKEDDSSIKEESSSQSDAEKKPSSEESQLNDEKKEDQIQRSKLQKEKELGREEAEAILNALKANESNMKKKIYKTISRVNLEKDW